MHNLLPWHQELFEFFSQQEPSSGAIILYGPEGAGKQRLLESLIPQGQPDVLVLSPIEDEAMGVEMVRSIGSFMHTQAHQLACKEVLIFQADKLTLAAMQALLKPLEEPQVPLRFWLVVRYLAQLPATIRSRCQQYYVPLPPIADALLWLKAYYPALEERRLVWALRYCHGSPLLAKEWLEKPTERFEIHLDALGALISGKSTAFSILSMMSENVDVEPWFDVLPLWFQELMHNGSIALTEIADWQSRWIASIRRRLEVPSLNLKLELYQLLHAIEQGIKRSKQ